MGSGARLAVAFAFAQLTACGLIVGVGDHHLADDGAPNDAAPDATTSGEEHPTSSDDASKPIDATTDVVHVDGDALVPSCAVKVLATGQYRPRNVIVDSDAVYWLTPSGPGVMGTIMRRDLTAGATAVPLVTGLADPYMLRADPHFSGGKNWLFFTDNGSPSGLFHIARDGGAVENYDFDNAAFHHLTVQGYAVSETIDRDSGVARLRRSDVQGTADPADSCIVYDPARVTSFPAMIEESTSTEVWFADTAANAILHVVNDCARAPATVFAANQSAVAMAQGSGFLYWVTSDGAVRSLTKTTPGTNVFNTFLISGLVQPSGLSGGGNSHLAVTDRGTGFVWLVSRTQSAILLATGQSGAHDIASTATQNGVIWANETSGEIVECDF